MSKSIFEKYEDMLTQDFLFGSGSFGSETQESSDEEFITSEEIVKMHKDGHLSDDELSSISKGNVEIEEDVYFKRYSKKRPHKYTQKELDEIREGCKATIVHDYSELDPYHISDEERAKYDSLAELSTKLGTLKKIYRKVDQYIYAMRIVVEAWEMVEHKENFMHDTEEFYQMVSDGRIYHTGILMPKLKGIDKYNIDLIIKYISNPELDPADLITQEEMKKRDAFYNEWEDDDEEEDEELLFSPDELSFIEKYKNEPPKLEVDDIKAKYIKGYDRRDFGKRKKKFSKKEKKYVESLHEILKHIQSNPKNRGSVDAPRTWLVTNSMFEPVKEEKDFWDDLYFDGSWTNKNDLFLYDMAIRDKILDQHPVGDKYMTYADKELQTFFRTMEDNGMNVVELRRKMNMSEEKEKEDEIKRNRKENKKIESALIQRITKLNGNPKFKKLISKAEKAINEETNNY